MQTGRRIFNYIKKNRLYEWKVLYHTGPIIAIFFLVFVRLFLCSPIHPSKRLIILNVTNRFTLNGNIKNFYVHARIRDSVKLMIFVTELGGDSTNYCHLVRCGKIYIKSTVKVKRNASNGLTTKKWRCHPYLAIIRTPICYIFLLIIVTGISTPFTWSPMRFI